MIPMESMLATINFLQFLSIAFGYSIALFPLLKSNSKSCYPTTILVLLVSGTPLIVDSDRIAIRAAACVVAVELLFKMLDFSRCCRSKIGPAKSFRNYLAFLFPFPVMAVSFNSKIRKKMLRGRIGALTVATTTFWLVVFLSAILIVEALSGVDAIRRSFVLDHVLKVAIFVVAIEALSRILLGLERLAGFQTTPLMRRIILSKSIGDFWSRYNTRVHRWFMDNLYRPILGSAYSNHGMLVVFFASAVLHEIAFAIATSRFTGYQFAFFMIQAPAIYLMQLATKLSIGRHIVGRVLLRVITIVWMWATSILFFHGVNQVFPFIYVSTPPT